MATTVHATCVSWQGQAVLIMGRSGQGKSALGLQLMALGCDLVADDRTVLKINDGQLIATCPPALEGLIEARGVGILKARHIPSSVAALCVDMDKFELERMPQRRTITLSGCDIPLIWQVEGAHFAAMILQILKSGWSTR